jgi:hypothetical protein
MRYSGLVSLPIVGTAAEQMQAVLDQIQSALKKEHVGNVQQVGNCISFSSGFSLQRWLRRGPLQMIGSGEIEAEPSGDSLMIDYRLSLYEPFISTAVLVLLAKATNLSRNMSLSSLALIWLLSSIMVAVSAVLEFSKFLRKFPRDDGASE